MTLRAHTPRRWVRLIATRTAERMPQLVVSPAIQNLVEKDLRRRLRGGANNRSFARGTLARFACSRNPRAVRAALHVWHDRNIPQDHLTLLSAPRGRAAQDGEALLELLRLARGSGNHAVLLTTLARAADTHVRGVDFAGVVDEVIAHGDPELTALLALVLARGDLTEVDRSELRTVASAKQRLLDGEPPGAVVLATGGRRSVVCAATSDLGPELGLDLLTELGTAILDAPDPEPAPLLRTARALRLAGDLELSLRLSERAAALDPADSRQNSTIQSLRETRQLRMHGWTPPERRAAAYEPQLRTVDYLLHSSLPHVSLGYATRTHGLLTALNAQQWDVRGITRPGFPDGVDDAPADEVVDGVTYARLLEGRSSFPLSPLLSYVDTYARLLEPLVAKRRTSLLHAASNHRNGMAAAVVGRRLGIPTIYEVRGLWEYTRQAREPQFDRSDLFALIARLEADAARAADRVITITRSLKDVLIDRGVAAEKIVVVPNGVDTERFRPMPKDTELAAELGVSGRTVIGYVGTVLGYEGLHLLIDAARRLRATREDFAVLIVGDGRCIDELAEQTERDGLHDVVHFTGRVPHDQVERYYSLIDIAPFPRLSVRVCELVSPLKPFEAMAMGKAVVVSSVAALTEIVDDGVNGLVFDKDSAPALTSALERLLDDPALLGRLAEEGRRFVVAERDWSALAALVAEVYADLERTRGQMSA